jgi:hypothetical protein
MSFTVSDGKKYRFLVYPREGTKKFSKNCCETVELERSKSEDKKEYFLFAFPL